MILPMHPNISDKTWSEDSKSTKRNRAHLIPHKSCSDPIPDWNTFPIIRLLDFMNPFNKNLHLFTKKHFANIVRWIL